MRTILLSGFPFPIELVALVFSLPFVAVFVVSLITSRVTYRRLKSTKENNLPVSNTKKISSYFFFLLGVIGMIISVFGLFLLLGWALEESQR